ncbi:MAG: hypothetical protein ABIO19_07025, partial [Burkholderiaceae bacterium]
MDEKVKIKTAVLHRRFHLPCNQSVLAGASSSYIRIECGCEWCSRIQLLTLKIQSENGISTYLLKR